MKQSVTVGAWHLAVGDVFHMGGKKYRVTSLYHMSANDDLSLGTDGIRISFIPKGFAAFENVYVMIIPHTAEVKVYRKLIKKNGVRMTRQEWDAQKRKKRLFHAGYRPYGQTEGKHKKEN